MNELSLHILDIAQNSLRANSNIIEIVVEKDDEFNKLVVQIIDNGCGMSDVELNAVKDPFYTSRESREIGLGIPLLSLSCQQADGHLDITSKENVGTTVTAIFKLNSVNRPPLGDIVDTIYLLTINDNNADIIYKHIENGESFIFDTRKIKEILDGLSIKDYTVMKWLKSYLSEGIENIKY